MISRRIWVALACGGVVAAAGTLGFAPMCRAAAARAAERYGASITVASVAPTWRGVVLRGVDVGLSEVPSVRVHLDAIEVAYGSGGRRVSLRGGVVSALGPRETVLAQIEAWRARQRESPSQEGGAASGNTTELAGFEVSWADAVDAPRESLHASGVGLERRDGGFRIAAQEASVALGRTSLSMKEGRLDLNRSDGGYRVAGLAAAEVVADVTLPVAKQEHPEQVEPASADPPPVEPPPSGRPPRGKGIGSKGLRAERAKGGARAKEPRGSAAATPATATALASAASSPGDAKGLLVREAMVGAARAVDHALEPGATIQLQGLKARLRRGDEILNLGPGALRVSRSDGRLLVELAPGARPPASPGADTSETDEALTFRLSVPLGEAPDEIVADVQGGPIWLSTLGVKEGDFGLFDVARAALSTRSHLALSADGRTLRVDGEAKLRSLSLRSAALSDEPVAGLELALRLKGELALDGTHARIGEGEVDLGAIRVLAQGDYDHAGGAHHFRGTFDVPLTACQSMLDSMPKGLVPKLQGMRFAGSFALRGRVDADTAHLDHGFVLDWDAANSCRVVEAPAAISVDRFRAPFKRTAYDPEGRPVSIETGPGTPDWVPRSAISKFMEVAVLTTEDGGFHRHHGFDHEAIRNSIRENLRRRRFVRGASTISMQLAKNLYLDRGKNLSRKLQEAVLTMYLEQELTKDQILELYFNVVEFGPMVYGIGPAARYYYNTTAQELTLSQALYISSIMPNPKVQHFGAGGAVSASWMAYLRKLMKLARDRDLITDEELDEGLRETVVRGSPTPARSARPESEPEQDLPTDGLDDGAP